MNIFPSDNWKLVLFLVLILIGMTFFGALALADADILNRPTAESMARRTDSLTYLNEKQREIEIEQYARLLEAETAAGIALIEATTQETIRKEREENNIELNTQANIDAAKILFTLLTACGILVVVLYGLLMAVHRIVDWAFPRRRGSSGPPIRTGPPSRDPWNDPDFRRMRCRQARRREREERRKNHQ